MKAPSFDFHQTMALFGENAVLVEEMYKLYLNNPNAVDLSWQNFFKQFTDNIIPLTKTTAQVIGAVDSSTPSLKKEKKEQQSHDKTWQIALLIQSYRKLGHFLAKLDPLSLEQITNKENLGLNIKNFGFTEKDLNTVIEIKKLPNDLSLFNKDQTLQELIDSLEKIYCSKIGVEFTHINSRVEQDWLFHQFEMQSIQNNLSSEEQIWILKNLIKAEGFEQFLHTKFPGAKRFSIEGGESTIVALNYIIQNFVKSGGKEVAIGMAHRGRLNTLANVLNKPYKAILSEFLGTPSFPKKLGIAGDVKYHMGYQSKQKIDGSEIILGLAANPSHLEAVNSVVTGSVRAKQDSLIAEHKSSIASILLHGDAAFCGQGVVAENTVMAGLAAYNTQGTIHIITNNQVGFTADPEDAHTGRYVTEVAKIAGAPILHINGDDPESVIRCAELALNYRNKFRKDVVIDIICYRKYGHNEGDEPAYTQSVMYNIIHNKQTPATIYANKLVQGQVVDTDFLENNKKIFKELLDREYLAAKDYKPVIDNSKLININNTEVVDTGVNKEILQKLGETLCNIPNDFALHPKLKTLFDQRAVTLQKDEPIDWATAEQLALGSLLAAGTSVRLVGQDSGRGTFSHRHSVLYDQRNNKPYLPFNNIGEKQGNYFVADSNLSEYAALGFEYGYSLVRQNDLVIWEAQFGDFANGAQIIIDQFIASGRTKWLQDNSLVMLLPHGYEGQGPEHSSARLERFLQLAAENNIRVIYPTTPASIFHALRRQIYSKNKIPLIVMSPKSLLRHKLAVSHLTDINAGTNFTEILDEQDSNIKTSQVEKIICCSGKVYYDLLEARLSTRISNIAIIRLEQLYPFANDKLSELVKKYINAKEFIFVQEEPENMGSWTFIREYLNEVLFDCNIKNEFKYIGRKKASSPASGYLYMHADEQKELISKALAIYR